MKNTKLGKQKLRILGNKFYIEDCTDYMNEQRQQGVHYLSECPYEVVYVLLWLLCIHCGIHGEEFFICLQLLGDRHGKTQLPVSLTIQLVCADEAGATRLCGAKEDHICWHSLVLEEP